MLVGCVGRLPAACTMWPRLREPYNYTDDAKSLDHAFVSIVCPIQHATLIASATAKRKWHTTHNKCVAKLPSFYFYMYAMCNSQRATPTSA